MCGIFGIASPEPLREPQALLEALTDRLAHRGPDGRGSYIEPCVFLGHRRLSIIDPGGGAQPMSAAGGRFTLVYNGALYNFKELRGRLQDRGHRFQTDGDTEVVLRSYLEWGADCIERFHGMYAFGIWNSREGELFLARDRLGVKPLYYAYLGNRLVFASEMKAILGHPDFGREANMKALSSYLSFRTVVGEDTVFVGLKTLAPGHHLRWKAGMVTMRQYWDVPAISSREDRGEAFYLASVSELVSQAVRRRLVSDVPVGAYLSGGLDSSLMVSWLAQMYPEPLATFSIGFEGQGYDEGDFAQTVSDHCGTRHKHVVMTLQDYLDQMGELIRHRDQPLSIPHEVALYRLSLEVRKEVRVCLSGEGADELFGGYGRVQRSPMDYKKVRLFHALPTPVRGLLAQMIEDPDLSRRVELRDEVAHLLHVYRWWDGAAKREILSPEARAAIEGDSELHACLHALFAKARHGDAYDRIFYFFEKVHLLNLLTRLDVQSMAASVEARVPFVDHELVEFVSKIPIQYKLRWKSPWHMLRAVFMKSENASERLDTTKYLLRKLAHQRLPDRIVKRRKLGFPVPLNSWLAGALGQVARDVLLDPRTRARRIFDPEKVEKLLAEPERATDDDHGKRVWMLMNVELWFREHVDRSPRPELTIDPPAQLEDPVASRA